MGLTPAVAAEAGEPAVAPRLVRPYVRLWISVGPFRGEERREID